MFRARLSFAMMAFVLLLPSSRLFALDDWQPINPEELKMAADPAHPADAIILYHEETADDMTHHRYVYKRVKIFTERGKRYGDVAIEYDGSIGGISDIKGRTITPDGTITQFTGKAFNTTVLKAHGIKYLAKTFALPNVQIGSIIEWKYTEYWDDLLFAPHWVIQDNLFQKRAKFTFIPFDKAGYTIHDERGDIKDRVLYLPIGLPENIAIKPTVNNHLELELKDIPAFEEEEYSPPSDILKMQVDFYYGTSKTMKAQDFWKDEGKYWNKEVEKFIGRSGAVASATNQVVSASDTPEQKARKIYAYVQKAKNLNYQRDTAILEEISKEPRDKRTVEGVLRRNAGFSNDIARLFVAMARAANVPAYLMRIADREKTFFRVNVPNEGQLTVEIAVVVLDGKEVFLDPGTPLCPFGLLAWQHTSSQGLRQTAAGTAELASTPTPSYKDAVSKRVGKLVLAEDGSAHGKVAVAWAGEEALIHKLSGMKTDEAGRQKALEEELQEMLPNGSSVKFETANGWDSADAQLTATFSVEVPSLASNAGKRMLVPTNFFQSRSKQPFAEGERKNPVYFYYPYYAIDEMHITYPDSFRMENLPKTDPLRTAFSMYKVERTANGNTVVINRDFAMAGMAFISKDYPELRKFFSGVSTGDSEPLVLTSAK